MFNMPTPFHFEQDGQLIWKYNAGSSSIGCDTRYYSHFEWMDDCLPLKPKRPLWALFPQLLLYR
jgi:hypothetical protein